MKNTTQNGLETEENQPTTKASSQFPDGLYPEGLEPDLPEGPELEKARRKERGYTWLVRLELLVILAIIVAVLVLILR
jgi:hypothetical protein